VPTDQIVKIVATLLILTVAGFTLTASPFVFAVFAALCVIYVWEGHKL
jgi:hypothetical protein